MHSTEARAAEARASIATFDVASRGSDTDAGREEARRAAADAIRFLGADGQEPPRPLHEYDHMRYGPILGVSDHGGAAEDIRAAALSTPKGQVLAERGEAEPFRLGLCLDGERMTAGGELPIGIDEYVPLRLAMSGRLLFSTNVGTVVPLRHYRPFPVVPVDDEDSVAAAAGEVVDTFRPFVETDGEQVPLVVFLYFRDIRRADEKAAFLDAVRSRVAQDLPTMSNEQQIGLYQRDMGKGEGALFAIELASRAGLRYVAVDADVRSDTAGLTVLPGLLHFFSADVADQLLTAATEAQVELITPRIADVTTIARYLWNTLGTARSMGVNLGKFGLFPLSLPDQVAVIESVLGWFPDWTAAPAFYVDQEQLGRDRVYREGDVADAAIVWLDLVQAAGAKMVLFDCPDRTPSVPRLAVRSWASDRGRRLWRRDEDDALGILDDGELVQIFEHAESLGLRALWAGGLSLAQAFSLGERGAFGIFTTSATAERVPLEVEYPWQPTAAKPTYTGVVAVKTLLEAGFLAGATSRRGDEAEAEEIRRLTKELLGAAAADGPRAVVPRALQDRLIEAWRRHLS